MAGTEASTPGRARGATEPGLIAPELPKLQPLPGSSRSTRVTSAPRLRSARAMLAPTMPAPTTTTRGDAFVPMSARLRPLVRHHAAVLEDQLQAPHVVDVLQRVAAHHDQAGDLAHLHRSMLVAHAADGGAVAGGRHQRLPRRGAVAHPQ